MSGRGSAAQWRRPGDAAAFPASSPRPTTPGRRRCRGGAQLARGVGRSRLRHLGQSRDGRADRSCASTWRRARSSGSAAFAGGAAPDASRPTATPRPRRRSTPSRSTSPGRRGETVKLAALTHDGDDVWQTRCRPPRRDARLRHVADGRGRRRVHDQRHRRRRATARSSASIAARATSCGDTPVRRRQDVVRDAVRVGDARGQNR